MNYSQTKLRRRRSKYQNIIMKDYGLELCEFPTKVITICNGGLVNGINQEMIFEAFEVFGSIENVIMIPGKSYSFVLFKEKASSEGAYAELNNKEIWKTVKGPLFLAFTEQLPEVLNVNIDFNEKPPGLFVIENFITEEEEKLILSLVSSNSVQENDTKSSDLKNRKVTHFGYEFKYSNNNVDVKEPIKDIPKELDFIWDKILALSPKLGLRIDFRPDQLTVNNYQPGQGIPPHVDTHSAFEDPIVSLSLQSSVIMEFKNSTEKCCNVFLPARSICIMSGDSRYGWTHCIATRKSDVVPSPAGGLTLRFRKERTSLTYRKVRQIDCNCKFPHLCDTRQRRDTAKGERVVLPEEAATKIEESYVHEVYENIWDHFSETRHKPWPNVLAFVESFATGSIFVDIGCGNGKYFSKESRRCFEIGCDASYNLAKACRSRGFECFSCNCLRLPLRDGVADGCISIAVIHHLVTEERRKRALEEIVRVLRPQGRALIYVWAKKQERLNEKSSYLKQSGRRERNTFAIDVERVSLSDIGCEATLPVHANRTDFVHNDLLVPWKLKDGQRRGSDESRDKPNVFLRFYHVFEDDELLDLCSKLSHVAVMDYHYDQGNWCVVLQKK